MFFNQLLFSPRHAIHIVTHTLQSTFTKLSFEEKSLTFYSSNQAKVFITHNSIDTYIVIR